MEGSTWQYRKQSEPQESSSGDGWFMGDSRSVKAWVHGACARHIAWARRAEQGLWGWWYGRSLICWRLRKRSAVSLVRMIVFETTSRNMLFPWMSLTWAEMVSSTEIFAISFWRRNGTEHEAQNYVSNVVLGFIIQEIDRHSVLYVWVWDMLNDFGSACGRMPLFCALTQCLKRYMKPI